MEYNVVHNEAENRFEVEIDGLLSVVDYRNRDGVFLVTHTGVPKELSGQGIAAAINKAYWIMYGKRDIKSVRSVPIQ